MATTPTSAVAPGDAPACPGPPPPSGATRFTPPPGSVDTHAHVIGVPPEYGFVASRSYTPPEASEDAYIAMLDAAGMSYGVLVQVSVHGTDNRLMHQALLAHPDRLRGVAVLGLATPPIELQELHDAGVRGLRLNVLYGGGMGLDHLVEYGALCHDMGWHLQLLLDARTLPELVRPLSRLPVPVVVDHMGHFPAELGVGSPGFQALLSLVRDGGWVKLSGAYRLGGPPYAESAPLARALLKAAPSRCVWGSDWPHVATWDAMPRVGELLDLLADWAPDPAQRKAVLVDNPARLYGFRPPL